MKRTILVVILLSLSTITFGKKGTITHIIYIIKENRSFDSYFGAFPGVQSFCQGGHSPVHTVCIAPNDATSRCTSGDTCPQPTTIAQHSAKSYPLLLENALTVYHDISHTHNSLFHYNNNGAMDKFQTSGCPNSGGDPTANPCSYDYFDSTQIPIYYSYATTYGLADNFFSVLAPSMPGHLYIFAGSSHEISDNPTIKVGGKSCIGGTNPGLPCSKNSQCGSGTCSRIWSSGWNCDASHKGTSAPYTYAGSDASITTTTKLYCGTGSGSRWSSNGQTCTTNENCMTSPYLYCAGTNYWGGTCSSNSAQSCACYGTNGDPYSAKPSGCSDATDCGSDSPTCSTAATIGNSPGAPCPVLTTLGDQMDASSVSWKYYSRSPTWNPTTYVANIRFGPDFTTKVFGENQFATDAATAGGWCSNNHATACSVDSTCGSGNSCVDNSSTVLPQVSFVSPGPQNPGASEHPAYHAVHPGELWTQAQVNAVLSNPYLYNHSIIFITWDDSGGFWDHVPPPMVDGLNYGARVPLLCIGPYCVNGVNHLRMEFASVLRCMESIFSITPIGSRDTLANDACFGTGTMSRPGTGANAGMLNLAQAPIGVSIKPTQ